MPFQENPTEEYFRPNSSSTEIIEETKGIFHPFIRKARTTGVSR